MGEAPNPELKSALTLHCSLDGKPAISGGGFLRAQHSALRLGDNRWLLHATRPSDQNNHDRDVATRRVRLPW
jgi:hypothetical protein